MRPRQQLKFPVQVSHNLLKKETSFKTAIQGKCLHTGWREDYILKVMLG